MTGGTRLAVGAMRGRLISVVGPSGAGKDTLLAALAPLLPRAVFVRRVITRPAIAGGEAHEAVTEAEFAARLARGDLAFHWHAHGISYGIPASIDGDLEAGRMVIFNGSRRAVPEIRRAYPALEVVMVTAPPGVLAERLAARGRESREEIIARLARADLAAPAGAAEVINDATPEIGAERLLAALSRSAESV